MDFTDIAIILTQLMFGSAGKATEMQINVQATLNLVRRFVIDEHCVLNAGSLHDMKSVYSSRLNRWKKQNQLGGIFTRCTSPDKSSLPYKELSLLSL